jgi:phosphoribosylamine-glycine ligase
MQTINIIAHTEDASQIEAVKAFMKALKIKFELTKQEDNSVFIAEMQNSLNQVQQIKKGKLPKQSAKEFLNEL